MSAARRRLASTALAVGAVAIAFGAGRALSAVVTRPAPEEGRPTRSPSQLTGAFLPATLLRSSSGTVRLREHVGSPTLVIVADKEVCLSCANFPLEMRVLANDLPGLRSLLVLTGPDTIFFRRYARRNGVPPAQLLLDPRGDLPRDLGVAHGPVVLLVDASGRILWTDTRTGPQFGPMPVSRVLPLLHAVLDGAPTALPVTPSVADPLVRGAHGRRPTPADSPQRRGEQ